jgi:hypothetical protein
MSCSISTVEGAAWGLLFAASKAQLSPLLKD